MPIGAMILTSNKSYVEWGKMSGDNVLAIDMLDRISTTLLHSISKVNLTF